jgi:mono/diheme cytochrome c family protein
MKRTLAVLALLALGCGSRASGATCPTGSALTYDTFGRAFLDRYCTACHGGTGTQPALSSLTLLRASATLVDEQAASGASTTNTAMPPSAPTPTMIERQQLGEWLACGAR